VSIIHYSKEHNVSTIGIVSVLRLRGGILFSVACPIKRANVTHWLEADPGFDMFSRIPDDAQNQSSVNLMYSIV
jgi:hypothetical protein